MPSRWAPQPRGIVRSAVLAAVLAGLQISAASCGRSPEKAGPELAATWRGGSVTLKEVETELRARSAAGPQGRNDWVPSRAEAGSLPERYRSAAEFLVVQRVLAAGASPEAMRSELGEQAEQIEREARLALFLGPRLGNLEAGPAEVEKYFAEHRDEFRRAADRNLWHLFRRHRDPRKPEETIEFLAGLKRRAEAGEGFGQLAAEYSDSETRVLGGRLGFIPAGRLPKKLEEKVFAIPIGEIGEPIPLAGGAALFYVSEGFDARDFPLDEVRPAIAARLAEEKRRERIAELVAEIELPAGSTVHQPDQLLAALQGKDADAVILSVGDFRLTAGELARRLEETEAAGGGLQRLTAVERAKQLYRDLYHEQLLLIAAAKDELSEAQQQARDQRIAELSRRALAERRLEDLSRELMAKNEAGLRLFYEDNRHLYQSRLRFKLQMLAVPAAAGAPQLMARLEAARADLIAGKLDFKGAAKLFQHGELADLGWLDAEKLAATEAKVRLYVLELDGKGYTVPFQLNRRLVMIWVEDRVEPKSLSFEEARQEIEADYLGRNRQTLYREAVAGLLAAEGFRFEEENLRQHLAPPASRVPPPATPEPAAPADRSAP
jgi:hypothetical protein